MIPAVTKTLTAAQPNRAILIARSTDRPCFAVSVSSSVATVSPDPVSGLPRSTGELRERLLIRQLCLLRCLDVSHRRRVLGGVVDPEADILGDLFAIGHFVRDVEEQGTRQWVAVRLDGFSRWLDAAGPAIHLDDLQSLLVLGVVGETEISDRSGFALYPLNENVVVGRLSHVASRRRLFSVGIGDLFGEVVVCARVRIGSE